MLQQLEFMLRKIGRKADFLGFDKACKAVTF